MSIRDLLRRWCDRSCPDGRTVAFVRTTTDRRRRAQRRNIWTIAGDGSSAGSLISGEGEPPR
jgi:hypothetical protein